MSAAFEAAMIELDFGCPLFPVRAPIIDSNGVRCGCDKGAACVVPGKHPHITEWPQKATTDRQQIERWVRQWPGCNWGGVTGKRAGRVIIEIDTRAGGDDGLAELERIHGPLPATRTYRSGSGGSHYVFAYPQDVTKITNSAGELALGVDVRGDGGMGILPGSLHKSGNRYELVDDLPLAQLPAAWIALLADRDAPESRQADGTPYDGAVAAIEPVLAGCAFMAHVRDDAATLGEKDWWAGLSIAANCDDGIAVAHQLSGPYPTYSYEETEAKAQRARRESKPMSCREISKRTDGRWCQGCQHWGKIKSPINLGLSKRTEPRWEQHGQQSGSNDRTEPGEGLRLDLVSLADVQPKAVDWIWPNWLAAGKLHILAGHPGDGKSTVTAWLAAVLSIGGALPDGTKVEPVDTLFLLGEDAVDDTLRPRLDLHDADVSRIAAVRAVTDGKRRGALSLGDHLDMIRDELKRGNYRVMIVDPLTAFMPRTDRNSEGAVRDVLTPLADVADETGVAIVAIAHVGKGGNDNGRRVLQLVMGATAFGAAARVVWMNAEIQDSDEPKRRLLKVIKSNIGLKPKGLEWSRGEDGPLDWHGESDRDIEDVLRGDRQSALATAADFLIRTLAGGPMKQAAVELMASREGIASGTLRRAKQGAGVISEKGKEKNSPWVWRLPASLEGDQKSKVIKNDTANLDHLQKNLITFNPKIEDEQEIEDAHLLKHRLQQLAAEPMTSGHNEEQARCLDCGEVLTGGRTYRCAACVAIAEERGVA